jgi:2-polyprenyl-6-methoxyphenol hydroxylase-like FAD-dependent oxidoreductase
MPTTIHEPAREIPVAGEFDLCVIGGSCTGVFAAVRAARLGLRVAVVEQNIVLGGMAAAAQVNEWHSLEDTTGKTQIIGGLTQETLDRLRRRDAVTDRVRPERGPYFQFNSAELALELDAMILEHKIRLFLKTTCAAVVREGGRVTAVVIEDKTGRRAICARVFIDASGDGALVRRAGFAAWKSETLQPVSYQMLVAGLKGLESASGRPVWGQVAHLAEEFSYPPENAAPWLNGYPCPADVSNVYGPRLYGVDASDADALTDAVLQSRRHLRSFLDMVRLTLGPGIAPLSLAHALGIRETWHAACLHQLSVGELLDGRPFFDSIAAGTYPVDIHSEDGTMLRYLDGREEHVSQRHGAVWRRWRDDSLPGPRCYHIPYRSLIPRDSENVLVAGRLLDADREAYGGVRVMVNMNQTGEAAGVAAWLAIRQECPVAKVDAAALRAALRKGGSLFPGADRRADSRPVFVSASAAPREELNSHP